MKLNARLRASRILLTVATAIYGVLPLLADLSETHVLHPAWTPHARFHTVWLLATNSSLAALALFWLWRSSQAIERRLRHAGLLGLCVYGGFAISALTHRLYGGALADPDTGVPRILGLDANLVVFLPALALVAYATWLGSKAPGASP